MSTGWTPSGILGVPQLVGAAGRIRRDELDAAFLSTNEPGYAR